MHKSQNTLLQNINDINNISDKVTLKDIKVRWSLQRDLIDYDLNQKLLFIVMGLQPEVSVMLVMQLVDFSNYYFQIIMGLFVM